jgi:hypothetical protein
MNTPLQENLLAPQKITKPVKHQTIITMGHHLIHQFNQITSINCQTIIRPYLEQIINVMGDGHCGFRAVAYFGQGEGKYMPIRQKVVEELRKNRNYYMRQDPNMNVEETINISNVTDPRPCEVAHWMSMPSFG